MALRELQPVFNRGIWRDSRILQANCVRIRRISSTTTSSAEVHDLVPDSSLAAPPPSVETIKSFDPVRRARGRTVELPPSRYQFRPPKYYRGPLHPHQPPPPSDPSSRLFVPGPFSLPRLEQTYNSTIAPDLLTLAYIHYPPGFIPPQKGDRLRPWTGDSPYFKNRPLRGPRGGDVLRLLKQRTTFRNVPKITGITLHSMANKAVDDSGYLHVAGMVIQAITNARVQTHKSKKGVVQWNLRQGKYVSVTAELKGEDMYHFLGKTIDVVLPRIKDWKGVKGSSGDNSGNITFGLDPETVSLYPEVEVNYDMYPPKMIPGCHITVHTSAPTDREARLLLTAIGIPFYGKHVN